MMGSEYFTAAGYLIDDVVLCVNCGEASKLPVSDQITVATAEADFAEDGLWCGDCGATIVEPPDTERDDEDYEVAVEFADEFATLKPTTGENNGKK